MDGLGHLFILGGGRCRFDMRDQTGLILLTGLGQFLTVAGFGVIRRVDDALGGRHVIGFAPEDFVVLQGVLLNPDLPQDLYRGRLLHCLRGLWRIHPAQQPLSILTNGDGQAFPFPFCLGQTRGLKTRPVPLIPFLGNPGFQPVGDNPSQSIQGIPQGLPYPFQPVEVADGRLEVGRVCALQACALSTDRALGIVPTAHPANAVPVRPPGAGSETH